MTIHTFPVYDQDKVPKVHRYYPWYNNMYLYNEVNPTRARRTYYITGTKRGDNHILTTVIPILSFRILRFTIQDLPEEFILTMAEKIAKISGRKHLERL